MLGWFAEMSVGGYDPFLFSFLFVWMGGLMGFLYLFIYALCIFLFVAQTYGRLTPYQSTMLAHASISTDAAGLGLEYGARLMSAYLNLVPLTPQCTRRLAAWSPQNHSTATATATIPDSTEEDSSLEMGRDGRDPRLLWTFVPGATHPTHAARILRRWYRWSLYRALVGGWEDEEWRLITSLGLEAWFRADPEEALRTTTPAPPPLAIRANGGGTTSNANINMNTNAKEGRTRSPNTGLALSSGVISGSRDRTVSLAISRRAASLFRRLMERRDARVASSYPTTEEIRNAEETQWGMLFAMRVDHCVASAAGERGGGNDGGAEREGEGECESRTGSALVGDNVPAWDATLWNLAGQAEGRRRMLSALGLREP